MDASNHHSGICIHCEHARWQGDKPNPASKKPGLRVCLHPAPRYKTDFTRDGLLVVAGCLQYQRYPGAET